MKAYFLPGISYEINLFLVYFQIIFLSQHPNDLCTVEFLNSNFPTAPYDYFHRGLPILVQLNFSIRTFQPPHIPIFCHFPFLPISHRLARLPVSHQLVYRISHLRKLAFIFRHYISFNHFAIIMKVPCLCYQIPSCLRHLL